MRDGNYFMNTKSTISLQNPGKIATLILLFIVLGLAFFLRFKSCWFDYPMVTHPDEPFIIGAAERMLKNMDPNPHWFFYPSLVIYIQAAIIALVSAFKYVFLGQPPSEILPVDFHVAGRIVASIASVVSIFFVYLTGKRLFDARVGIFSSAIVAISCIHVENSALVTTDIWVAIFSVFILWHCAAIIESATIKSYLLAGAFVGLAAGAKYTAIVFFSSIIVAHVFRESFTIKTFLERKLIYAGLAAISTFFVTTPYALLDPRAVIPYVVSIGRHYRTGHAGHEAAGNTSWDLYFNAIVSDSGIGAVFGFLVLVSILLAPKTNLRILALVLIVPISLFILVGSHKVFFYRNIVGVIPCISIAAGAAIFALADALKIKSPKVGYVVCLYVMVFVIGGTPLLARVMDHIEENSLPDTRWEALAWIRENIPEGSNVAVEKYAPPISQFDKRLKAIDLGLFMGFNVELRDKRHSPKDSDKIDESVEYVMLSSGSYGRFFQADGTPIEMYSKEAGIYNSFFKRNRLIYELKPEKGVRKGPVVKVFENSLRIESRK